MQEVRSTYSMSITLVLFLFAVTFKIRLPRCLAVLTKEPPQIAV